MTQSSRSSAPIFNVSNKVFIRPKQKQDIQICSNAEAAVFLSEAYKTHSVLLLKYCYLRLPTKEKAIDTVQETFVHTWMYLLKGNTIHDAKSFLFTTAQHLIIDEYRKKKCSSLDCIINTSEEPRVTSLEDIYMQEEVEQVAVFIESLPLLYSVAMRLRYVDDLSVKEIAVLLNKTDSSISVILHRGIKMIQKSLGQSISTRL